MGTRVEALQEMCAQFERNAADARRECDALRETLKQVVQRASSLESRLNAAHTKISADQTTIAVITTKLLGVTVRIQTFNTASLWRRILTAIRGDL